jgi:hypothetical protein
MNKIEKILNKKTLSAQDKVILENELFVAGFPRFAIIQFN